MNRSLLCRCVQFRQLLGNRYLFSAAQSLQFAPGIEYTQEVNTDAATVGVFEEDISTIRLRDSTAAVASRLVQQTQFPLLPGTPFTLEGALTVNPLKQPRLIATPGSNPTVVFANEEWCKLCRFSSHELIGTGALEALLGPGTVAQTKEKIRDAFERKTRVRVDVINFTKDHMPFMMQLQISPLLDKRGRFSYVLASVKHI